MRPRSNSAIKRSAGINKRRTVSAIATTTDDRATPFDHAGIVTEYRRKENIVSRTGGQNDWSKPAAMAIPQGGFFKDKVEQGRYGPIFPKTPACYGFTIIAKVKSGLVEKVRAYGKTIEETIARLP